MHDYGLIVTLAAGLSSALILGYITHRIGLSPILGYLIAGIAVGPFTPGFVADPNLAGQLAEVGVILLMFGVGLHFHPKDLMAVKGVAIPGAIGQSFVATALSAWVAHLIGWSWSAGLVLGMAISVASTVVLMRGLSDRLETPEGRIAVGWLIVEDVFTVLVLVLLPAAFGPAREGAGALPLALGLAVLKLAFMTALILVAGGRVVPWLLGRVARTKSQELFTLSVLAVALAIAAGSSYLFGASMALGAFLAGMVVGQTKVSHQAAANALPMRDAFAVLFFVSVGMLFDPKILLDQPTLTLAVLGIILVAKPLAALAIVLLLGHPVRTGLTVAVGLAQIGEFSFILGDLALRLGVLPAQGQSVLVAGAIVSIAINPLLFRASGTIENWLRWKPKLWRLLNARAEARGRASNAEVAGHLTDAGAIVVGYGPVGQTVTAILEGCGVRPVVIDMNVDTVLRLTGEGRPAIYGDAGLPDILRAAGVARAKYLIVTLPDLAGRIPVIVAARDENPSLRILCRARYIAEHSMLEEFGATGACYEEAEAAVALSEVLLRAEGTPEGRILKEVEKIRTKLAIQTPAAP